MDKRLVIIAGIIGLAVIIAGGLPLNQARAGSCCPAHGGTDKIDMKGNNAGKTLSLEKIHSERFPVVAQSIDKAVKAVESGDKETALAELDKARKMLAAIHEAISKHLKPKFANTRCPIMGSPVKTQKVAGTLIRDYKGRQIAFCCAGCPSAWDKLSDDEKTVKLAQVVTPDKHTSCSMH